jgi:hypothetical protein
MKYIALKVLPHGQQPGELFEESEAIGNVLITVGAARLATEDEIPSEKPSSRRRYSRRDLVAES